MSHHREPLTVVGATAAEAMALVKAELGEGAVLLGQRGLVEAVVAPRSGGAAGTFRGSTLEDALAEAQAVFGTGSSVLGQREVVELTAEATPDDDPAARLPAGAPPPGGFLSRVYGRTAGADDEDAYADADAGPREACPWPRQASAPVPSVAAGGAGDPVAFEDICSRLGAIERLLKQGDRPSVPAPLTDAYMAMVENEVAEDLARRVVERMNEEAPPGILNRPEKLREALRRAVARLITVEGPIRRREDGRPTVVVVVGPTGVGKTTSIAKLATRFRVQDRMKVALVTEDTSRPGGAEQLRSVAQLLSIPLAVADTVERLRAAIQRNRDQDVILIDTAGRAPCSEASLRELAEFLRAIRPDEVHLALCSHSGSRHMLNVIERFRMVEFNRILLTKLDEAVTHGLILNVAATVDRGLSYVTTGQDYMESIEPGDPERLAALVLGETSLCDAGDGRTA